MLKVSKGELESIDVEGWDEQQCEEGLDKERSARCAKREFTFHGEKAAFDEGAQGIDLGWEMVARFEHIQFAKTPEQLQRSALSTTFCATVPRMSPDRN